MTIEALFNILVIVFLGIFILTNTIGIMRMKNFYSKGTDNSVKEKVNDKKILEEDVLGKFKYLKYINISLILVLFIVFFTLFFSPVISKYTNKIDNINDSAIFTALVLVFAVFISFLIKPIKNYSIKKKIKANGNRMMEFPSEHSAGEISYILNSNIEKDKDLSATILNIVSKNCIKIEKINDEYKIIDLKYNIDSLKEDEKYIYEWLVSEDKSNYSYSKWREIIKKEIEEQNIFTESNFNPKKAFYILFFPTFFLSFIIMFLNVNNRNNNLGIILFFVCSILFALYMFFSLIWNAVLKDKKMYSKEGAKIAKGWNYFKRYLKLYSNIENAELQSVIIWEKYLAYAIVLGVNLNYKKLKLESIPTIEFLNESSIREKIDTFIDKVY